MKTKLIIMSTIIGSLLNFALPALSVAAGNGNPCAADLKAYCPTARTHEERAACLSQHEATLSPACSQVRDQSFETVCGNDVRTLCGTLPAAHDSLPDQVACLRKNPKTSAGCLAVIKK